MSNFRVIGLLPLDLVAPNSVYDNSEMFSLHFPIIFVFAYIINPRPVCLTKSCPWL